jgi:hypothetical protein
MCDSGVFAWCPPSFLTLPPQRVLPLPPTFSKFPCFVQPLLRTQLKEGGGGVPRGVAQGNAVLPYNFRPGDIWVLVHPGQIIWAGQNFFNYITLRSVSSLNDPQNREMKICEKYEVDILKIIIIIIGYTLK